MRYSDDGKVCTLKSIRLFEISLCAVPANQNAVVQSVKSLAQVESLLRGDRSGDVTDEVFQQLKGIDSTLRALLRKDAACSCACDSAGDCPECSDLCSECDSCVGCIAARADEAAIVDAFTAAAADLKKMLA